MVKVRVLSEFHDINNFRVVHKAGEEIDVDEERATDLCQRKLAESAEGETSFAGSGEKKARGRKKAESGKAGEENEAERSVKEAEEKLKGLI